MPNFAARLRMIAARSNPPSTAANLAFPVTPLTEVLAACAPNDAGAPAALGRLAGIYYPAIVGYFRVKAGPERAQDFAHDFVARLLRNQYLTGFQIQPPIRFRNYLSAMLRRFWVDHVRWSQAVKRGGGQVHQALDSVWGDQEADFPAEPPEADSLLDQQAALAFHTRAMARLVAQNPTPRQQERLAALRHLLVFEADPIARAQLAARLGLTMTAFRQAVFRLRDDYYVAFRLEVAQTVRREDIDDEMRHLVVLLPAAGAEANPAP